MRLAGSALLALSAGPAAAATLGDWFEGTEMAIRFVAAGIPARSFITPSGGMAPTLVSGDVFLADLRDAGKMPRRGDVIVFYPPRDTSVIYFKRVIGLPGDRVQLTDGRLLINRKLLNRREITPYTITLSAQDVAMHRYVETLPPDGGPSEPYEILERSDKEPFDDTPEYVVPPGHCFTLGDNRDNSNDSRVDLGYVSIGNIIGRAVYRLRPNSGWLVPPETVPGLG
ncbi:MAG: signal peptidase I [Inquilinus limosus]|uniref:Signal peptidase I n=1 Tax=Inquilinus limosus TaxID=171674 RepID=A0A952KIQ1_9PROT|nr:signal peptidase I [Inquilinus limosus]